MEQEWGATFVHESGHALMAVIQGIDCYGIYLERCADGNRFCALFPHKGPGEWSSKDYLVSAAGVAAESLIYPGQESQGAGVDRRDFESSNAPSFEMNVHEARVILAQDKRKLKRLVSILKSKARNVDFDLARLPEKTMDGTDKTYLTLIDKDELKAAIDRN